MGNKPASSDLTIDEKLQEIYVFLERVDNDPAYPEANSSKKLLKINTRKPPIYVPIVLWVGYLVTLIQGVFNVFFLVFIWQLVSLCTLGLMTYTILIYYTNRKIRMLTRGVRIERIYLIITQDHLSDVEKMLHLIMDQIFEPLRVKVGL